MRSGINPLEALKKLEGRVVSLHFKDLNEASPDAHDVPWGTGKADVKALLTELKRQGFKGVFSIEYEHNWENSVPDIAQCVANFDALRDIRHRVLPVVFAQCVANFDAIAAELAK